VTPAAIEAAARALHRFNAPRVANDVEPWESVPPNTQMRWRKQAELALLAAEETVPVRIIEHPADPFERLRRPNIDTDVTPPPMSEAALTTVAEFLKPAEHDDEVTKVEGLQAGRER